MLAPNGHAAKPSADQPGSLGEQLTAITIAIYLGERRDTSARDEWQDARKLVLPHAKGDQR